MSSTAHIRLRRSKSEIYVPDAIAETPALDILADFLSDDVCQFPTYVRRTLENSDHVEKVFNTTCVSIAGDSATLWPLHDQVDHCVTLDRRVLYKLVDDWLDLVAQKPQFIFLCKVADGFYVSTKDT